MLFRTPDYAIGSPIFELNHNNTITEWVLSEATKNGLRTSFLLKGKDTSSFRVCDSSEFGKTLFGSYGDAAAKRMKNAEKRNKKTQ